MSAPPRLFDRSLHRARLDRAAVGLAGNVTANGLTKFGSGTLVLNGNVQVLGSSFANGFAVQDGTLRVGSSAALLAGVTALNVNLGATVDLNGNTLSVGSLNAAANTLSAEQIEMQLRLAILKHLPDIIRESVKPMEQISDIKILRREAKAWASLSKPSGSM